MGRIARFVTVCVIGFALAGCASAAEKAASSQSSAAASAASAASLQALIDEGMGIEDWPPAGMKEYGTDLAWMWTDVATVKCKAYQDDCYGITVASKYGCSGGVYIELAIQDASGAAIDRANEITAGLQQEGIAKAVLSPPSGVPSGAKARVSKLNCLG